MLLSRRNFVRTASISATTALLPGLPVSVLGTPIENKRLLDDRKRVIIDTDTATDDAVALLMAMNASNLSIEAITIAMGNVDFDQQVKNALYTVEMAGQSGKIPVYKGSAFPIMRQPHRAATYVHGNDGMGDSFFPNPKQQPEQEHAIDAIIRLVNKYPGELTIIALGSLTNIALAILRDPSVISKLKAIYFMGGFYKFYGFATPAAGYNAWIDPEAAKIVFQSGMPITTIGTDISVNYSVFTDADYDKVAKLGTTLSDFFIKINRIRRVYCKEYQKLNGSNHPDAIAMALVIDPTIGTKMLPRFIEVETQGELTRGALLIDELGVYKKPPNAIVCAEANEEKFKKMVFDTLKSR